jgi:peptide/nickel transport system permease protein
VTPVVRFIVRRLLSTVVVLVVVAAAVFAMVRLTGDPAAIMAGDGATLEQIQQVRASLGLERPLPLQFGAWMGRALRGDLGESFYYKTSISGLIAQHVAPTLALTVSTVCIAVLVAVPMGALAAWRRGGWLDRALMGFSTVGFSIPVFGVGYLLIWVAALKLGWLPVQGYARASEGIAEFVRHLALPSMTLSVVYIALIARASRAAVSDALAEDFIRTARAKGLSEWRVLVRHALANGAVSIVTVIGIALTLLLGGAVVTERVFAIPGLGGLIVNAVEARDFPVVQAIILLFSVTYVFVNLVIDLGYLLLDPRIRY